MSIGTANAQGANLITNGDFLGTLAPASHTGSVTASSVAAYEASPINATNGDLSNSNEWNPYALSAITAPLTFAALSTNGSTVSVSFLTTAGTNYSLSFENGYFASINGNAELLNASVKLGASDVVATMSTSRATGNWRQSHSPAWMTAPTRTPAQPCC
jgi:hypothetical protein